MPINPQISKKEIEQAAGERAPYAGFAGRLKTLMLRESLRVTDMARILDTSKSGSAVGNWLRGHTMPSHENVAKLASLFDVSVEWLLYGREKVTTPTFDKGALDLAAFQSSQTPAPPAMPGRQKMTPLVAAESTPVQPAPSEEARIADLAALLNAANEAVKGIKFASLFIDDRGAVRARIHKVV